MSVFGCLTGNSSFASSIPDLGFSVHKLESGVDGHTLLIIGGIQGDEPGGFNAASLIVTHYDILSGNVWVVPNLNFLSIIKRSRGVYGDLNRKFDKLHPKDPEYHTIEKIKKLIIDPKVDLVLNLHDGSGFYRNTYHDILHNQNRWGQCIIIDQERVNSGTFSNLTLIAKKTVAHVNNHLLNQNEHFNLNNTKTQKGNEEMAKTLTYFAIKNHKSAFGVEASKSFPTAKRAYYHLLAIESFFNQAGIKFKRNFKLSERHIKTAIDDNIQVALNNRKILLKIENVRNRLNYIPLKKNSVLEFQVNNPLMTIVTSGNEYRVFHGNRQLTHLYPQYFDYDFSLDAIDMIVDGVHKTVPFGNSVTVKDEFMVKSLKGHRVNVIGFTKPEITNESGMTILKRNILKQFSIDKKGTLFRVEVYKSQKFSGMVLVDFGEKPVSDMNVAYEEKIPEILMNIF
ncbi:M14 family metallopeptidase [Desulfobacula phenolica]|uniref:Carboxypeptidase controlling helical cell shape n=1 Tax=Desulfobacula phenolica TaxID=90732 RepID=A0A1H2JFT8_9BACT|nr:M14 family metallopeptidase [Desulfobacula phenolica]SDU55227.1 Carboxypeptidase controlling helical cell shape [Desulfobacula phenolica]